MATKKTTSAAKQGTQEAVPVLFRVWKPAEGDGVFALFPTVPSDNAGHYVDAYEDGAFSGASLVGCISASRPAELREYEKIKRELENRHGYNLKVYERTPPDAREEFLAALRTLQGSSGGKGGGGAVGAKRGAQSPGGLPKFSGPSPGRGRNVGTEKFYAWPPDAKPLPGKRALEAGHVYVRFTSGTERKVADLFEKHKRATKETMSRLLAGLEAEFWPWPDGAPGWSPAYGPARVKPSAAALRDRVRIPLIRRSTRIAR